MGNIFRSKIKYDKDEELKEKLLDDSYYISYSDETVEKYRTLSNYILINNVYGHNYPKIIDGTLITPNNIKPIMKWLLLTNFSVIENLNMSDNILWLPDTLSNINHVTINITKFIGVTIYSDGLLRIVIPFETIDKIKKFLDIFIAPLSKTMINITQEDLLKLDYNWNSIIVLLTGVNKLENFNKLNINRLLLKRTQYVVCFKGEIIEFISHSALVNSTLVELSISIYSIKEIEFILTCEYLTKLYVTLNENVCTESLLKLLSKSTSLTNIKIKQKCIKANLDNIIECVFINNILINTLIFENEYILLSKLCFDSLLKIRQNCVFSIKLSCHTSFDRFKELCYHIDKNNVDIDCHFIINDINKETDIETLFFDYIYNQKLINFLLKNKILEFVPELKSKIMKLIEQRQSYDKTVVGLCEHF